MNVAVIGASGRGGSRIAAELAGRGHSVTAIARNPEKIADDPRITRKRGDLYDPDFPKLLAGHDAVVSAVHFTASDPQTLIGAVRAASVKRYLVMGGAGSLEVAPGVKLVDTPEFPAAYKTEALKGSEFLDLLRKQKDLDWVFLSPAAEIDFGQRTGRFRTGSDQLLVDDKGRSRISFEDFGVAVADELERPRHRQQRFTVAC